MVAALVQDDRAKDVWNLFPVRVSLRVSHVIDQLQRRSRFPTIGPLIVRDSEIVLQRIKQVADGNGADAIFTNRHSQSSVERISFGSYQCDHTIIWDRPAMTARIDARPPLTTDVLSLARRNQDGLGLLSGAELL